MKPYAVYLRIEAAELLKSVATQNRRGIEDFVDSLSGNPFKTGDYTETDAVGRPIQIKSSITLPLLSGRIMRSRRSRSLLLSGRMGLEKLVIKILNI